MPEVVYAWISTRLLRIMAMRRWLSAVWPKVKPLPCWGRRGASGITQVSAGGGGRRAGRMMGDQLLYLLGRCYGGKILRRFPRYHTKIRRAQKMIQRHPYLFVIGTRFMYGFRVVGPLLIGASRLPPKIFLPLNIVGALIWALLFTTLGYLGGEVIAPWLHDLDQHLRHGVWLILAIVLVVGVRWWLKRRSKAEAR